MIRADPVGAPDRGSGLTEWQRSDRLVTERLAEEWLS